MAAGAGVALEDDVAALVECEAVVLVGDGAILDRQVGSGDVETVAEIGMLSVKLIPFATEFQSSRVVASSLATGLAVRGIASSYVILG